MIAINAACDAGRRPGEARRLRPGAGVGGRAIARGRGRAASSAARATRPGQRRAVGLPTPARAPGPAPSAAPAGPRPARDRVAGLDERSLVRSAAATTRPRCAPRTATGQPARRRATPRAACSTFGRYAGWSLGEIARRDLEYVEWLDRMPIGRPYRDEIDVVLRGPAGDAPPRPSANDRRGLFRQRWLIRSRRRAERATSATGRGVTTRRGLADVDALEDPERRARC